MRPDLVLIGLSGNAREVLEAAEAAFRVVAILSDDPAHAPSFEGIPVHPLSRAAAFGSARFLFLIGSARSHARRLALLDGLSLPEDRFATLVHATASVSRFARLGAGCVLMQRVTVTANARFEGHAIVLPHSVIHHDVRIGRGAILGANVTVAGGVRIGECAYVGSGSAIRDGVRIGDGALVGLGSVVVRDVAPATVVAGNPARPLVRPGPGAPRSGR